MKKKNHYDILIIGAGLSGLLMASLLGSYGIKACIIEKSKSKDFLKNSDHRTTALSQGTKRLFEELNIWKYIEDSSQPINQIVVEEQCTNNELNFDSSELNEGELGFIVKNTILKSVFLKEINKNDKLQILFNSQVEDLKIEEQKINSKSLIKIKNNLITSDLVIVADGRFSQIRNLTKVKFFSHDYHQSAYIFNIKHKYDHKGIALERFFPQGPLAILPMRKNKRFYESSVVWTIDNDLGDFSSLSANNFKMEFLKRYDNYFGDLISVSKPTKYNLDLRYNYSSILKRLVFIGDSSQAIHPIAGQGFNLAVRDCKTLSKILLNQKIHGLDVGNEIALSEYEKKRFLDKKLFIEATHQLNLFFSNNKLSVKKIRSLGLNIVNNIGYVKNELMLIAMGLKDFNRDYLFR